MCSALLPSLVLGRLTVIKNTFVVLSYCIKIIKIGFIIEFRKKYIEFGFMNRLSILKK